MAAVAMLGIAGIAFGLYAFLHGKATQPAASFQSMKMRSLLSEPDVRLAVLSADGRYLAYTLIREARWSLRVRQVATGGDVEILKPQESEIRGITFSPDGNYLFYTGRD